MTVSAPQRIAHTILSTSAATSDGDGAVADIGVDLDGSRRPIAIGSDSGWLMLLGMIARPSSNLVADELGGDEVGDGGAEVLAVPRLREGIARPRFSRAATSSISGVMMPRRA